MASLTHIETFQAHKINLMRSSAFCMFKFWHSNYIRDEFQETFSQTCTACGDFRTVLNGFQRLFLPAKTLTLAAPSKFYCVSQISIVISQYKYWIKIMCNANITFLTDLKRPWSVLCAIKRMKVIPLISDYFIPFLSCMPSIYAFLHFCTPRGNLYDTYLAA